jgi:hypothetical protein
MPLFRTWHAGPPACRMSNGRAPTQNEAISTFHRSSVRPTVPESRNHHVGEKVSMFAGARNPENGC